MNDSTKRIAGFAHKFSHSCTESHRDSQQYFGSFFDAPQTQKNKLNWRRHGNDSTQTNEIYFT